MRGLLHCDIGGLQVAHLRERGPLPTPQEPTDPCTVLSRIYHRAARAQDGRWLQFGNLLPHLLDNFLAAAGIDAPGGSVSAEGDAALEPFRDAMLRRIESKTSAEWMDTFARHGGVAAHRYQTTQAASRRTRAARRIRWHEGPSGRRRSRCGVPALSIRLALGGLLALLAVGAWLWPAALPAPREADVLAALLRGAKLPAAGAFVVSEPSDCRSGGETKAALPARLFGNFLGANGAGAQAFDLAPLAAASQLPPKAHAGKPAAALRAATARPVIAMSRAGLTDAEALVCITVFGKRQRAFFAVLTRSRGQPRWALARELSAWREEPELAAASAAVDEPLFSPRPSALDRALRER